MNARSTSGPGRRPGGRRSGGDAGGGSSSGGGGSTGDKAGFIKDVACGMRIPRVTARAVLVAAQLASIEWHIRRWAR